MTQTAVVLFTRDLRVHDHAGLSEAARAYESVLPLFVLDDRLLEPRAANRLSFLLGALADLRRSLRSLGSDLVVRRGDPVAETIELARAVGAVTVFAGADASSYARTRERRLRSGCAQAGIELRLLETVFAVPPGELAPEGRDNYRVFTPYWCRWCDAPLRPVLRSPRRLPPLVGVEPGDLPSLRELTPVSPSRELAPGGETAARRRAEAWLRDGLSRYEHDRDRLAPGASSGLSPYLHFGCLSAVELVARARDLPGSSAFLRQLCWRDFFGQLLAADPRLQRDDLRPPAGGWRDDPEALAAWREGRTGSPLVDAAMRQLAAEGWLPNRARLIAGSFLTRTLGLDWRLGADVFFELLVDGDVASNVGNWQWVAGTGANPRPGRMLDPARQARRFDPDGRYVRRYLPEPEAHAAVDWARRR